MASKPRSLGIDMTDVTDNAPVRFVGYPDGEKVFVAEFGTEVGTFTQAPGGRHPALKHHVPLSLRGPFRAEQLANYDPTREYRTDPYGFVLCLAKTKQDDKLCIRKAVNRYPRCVVHGGRLHPMDLLVKETGEPETEATMSRYQLYLAGQITTDDLDDEELLGFGFRTPGGSIFKPKNITRDMVTAFTKELFGRSLEKLKTSSLTAAETLVSLMLDETVDANVRRQCAESILDRTLGKAPLQVSITATAPWETVFESIAVTRQEPLDAEVVPASEIERPTEATELPDTEVKALTPKS